MRKKLTALLVGLLALPLLGAAPVDDCAGPTIGVWYARVGGVEPGDSLSNRHREVRRMVAETGAIFGAADLVPQWERGRGCHILRVRNLRITDASYETVVRKLHGLVGGDATSLVFVDADGPEPYVAGYGQADPYWGSFAVVYDYERVGWAASSAAHELVHALGYADHAPCCLPDLMMHSGGRVDYSWHPSGCTGATIDCQGRAGYLGLLQASPLMAGR